MDIRTHYADLFYRESDSLSVLEKNVKDFPASAIARFSLLYHYKKNNNPDLKSLRIKLLYISTILIGFEINSRKRSHRSTACCVCEELSRHTVETENAKSSFLKMISRKQQSIEKIIAA